MSPKNVSAGLRVTVVILVSQAVVTIVASALAFGLFSVQHGKSALIGGFICMSTSGFFGLRMFAGQRVPSADQVLRRFYSGLMQKFVLTAVLFSVAILWLDVEMLALILVYAISLSTFWFALLIKT